MSFSDYDRYDGLGLAELVRNKDVTPGELLDEAITRIDRVNPRINAVIYKLYDRARRQLDAGLPDGPFAGVPFLIKDLLSALAGEPLQYGSRMYRDYRPRHNSELVERYLATGAVIVGKTNTPELGLEPVTEPAAFGPSRNPWDTSRTTGGSSGGSGAAVAARLVPMAGGGDGGGSIRIPASACGIFGLKPSRGRTPTGPYAAEAWNGFAVEHVLTRSVRDSAAMLDAVAGDYPGDFHGLPAPATPFSAEVGKAPGRLRVAVSTAPLLPCAQVHPQCVAAVEDTATLLTELGHEVVEATPQLDSAAFAKAFLTVIAGQTAAEIRFSERNTGRKPERDDFEQRTWLVANLGSAFSAGEYVTAVADILAMSREVHRFLADYDVILNPTLALPPQPHGFLDSHGPQAVLEAIVVRLPVARLLKDGPVFEQAAADVFSFVPWTPVYNATGQPSMSVPLWWTDDGLPIGSMFTAKLRDEATLFRLAAQLEQARPWADKKPPVCA